MTVIQCFLFIIGQIYSLSVQKDLKMKTWNLSAIAILQQHSISLHFFVTSSSESLTRCVLLTFTFRNNIFMSGFCLRETLSTRLCYLNGKKKIIIHIVSSSKKQSAILLKCEKSLLCRIKDITLTASSISSKRWRRISFLLQIAFTPYSSYLIKKLNNKVAIVQQPFKLPK